MIGQGHEDYFSHTPTLQPAPVETHVSARRAKNQASALQRPRLANVVLASDHWCTLLTGFTPDQVRLLHAIGTANPDQIVLSLRPRVQWSISLLRPKGQEADQDSTAAGGKRVRRRKRMFEADDSLIVLLTYLHQGCALMEVYDTLNLDRHCSAATEQRRQQAYTDIKCIKEELDQNSQEMSVVMRKVQQNKVARTSMLIKDAITTMKASFVRAFIELPREFRDELFPPFPETPFPELNICPLMVSTRVQSTPRHVRLGGDMEDSFDGQGLRSEAWIGRMGLAAFVFSGPVMPGCTYSAFKEASESQEFLNFVGIEPAALNLENQIDVSMPVQTCTARDEAIEARKVIISQHHNQAASLFNAVTNCYRRDPTTYSDFIVLVHALTNYHILENMFVQTAEQTTWSKEDSQRHDMHTENNGIDIAL